jgi:hypothetical protein
MSSQGYIIEVGGRAAGIVVREQGESVFHFHAAVATFSPLDGKKFATPLAAERAAVAHVARRPSIAAALGGGAQ